MSESASPRMFDSQRFFPIVPEQLNSAWPKVAPLVEMFSRATCMVTPEEVLRQATRGDCQLWAYHDTEFRGIVATRIYPDAVGDVCELWLCFGKDVDALIDGAVEMIERWATDNGCYKTKIIGREGWQRRLTGYKRTAIVLEKSLVEVH